jgi:hypothetical protein
LNGRAVLFAASIGCEALRWLYKAANNRLVKRGHLMTTYQHTLVIGDSEYIALSDALKRMIEHCEAQMAAGAGAPYWAHKQSCVSMLNKLRAAPARMTSTNNFGE